MSRFYGFVAILVIICSIIEIESRTSEVRFVTVVFRHGDRAPADDGRELYPADPYLNYAFNPMGPGGLTNNGKMREFAIGQELRRRYGNFLGEIYFPKDIVARSTDYRRTKMSLYLVLASLYPPNKLQRWNSKLNWQPIPTTFEVPELDVLLIPEECPRYLKELERVKLLPEVMKRVEQFRPLMKNLTILTGRRINDTSDLYYLYHALMAESSMGLVLSKWTDNLFPLGPINDATILDYDIRSYNVLLKRLNGGSLLKRISEDMVAKAENGEKVAGKMNLFGGHETNVAALLQTLGVYDSRVPAYSSAVFVELVRRDNAHYVKVLHYLGIPPIVEIVTIPGCRELCPLSDFLRLLKNVTPTSEELECHKNIVTQPDIHINVGTTTTPESTKTKEVQKTL